MSSFAIPIARLGLAQGAPLEGYEFWSGSTSARSPRGRANPPDTDHPGDVQELLTGQPPGRMDVTFQGLAVKLICLRDAPRAPLDRRNELSPELRLGDRGDEVGCLERHPVRCAQASARLHRLPITVSGAGYEPRGPRRGQDPAPISIGSHDAVVVSLSVDRGQNAVVGALQEVMS